MWQQRPYANSIRYMASNTQTYTTTVLLNTEQAKAKLDDLQRKIDELKAKRKQAADIGNTDGVKQYSSDIAKLQKQFDTLNTTTKAVDKVLKNLSTAAVKDIRRTINAINKELASGNVERGSKEWQQLTEKLKACKTELQKIKAESAAAADLQGGWMGRLKSYIDESWGSLLTLKGTLQQAASWISGYVQRYADMEEAMANVTKYTGQTTEEIHAMQTELKAMDTRTSIEGLNELAGAAGRLGITAKDKILEFVDAADKINVALGDDLGEGAVDQIGKLAMAFGEDDRMGLRGAMLATGSAINELGANSAAQAGYLVDFTARLAGIGQQAGLTQTQIMGFGAVMDETMQRNETSTTALTQLISKMAQEPAKFAAIAGQSVEEFTNLVKNDMNGALLQLFDALSQKGGFTELAAVFPEMGMKGTQAAQVFSVIADKLQDVKRYQELATQAFEDGTSVMGEFDVQNNTVQARMDKTKKALDDVATQLGAALYPAVEAAQGAFTNLQPALSAVISLISTLVGFITRHTTLLIGLTTAIAAYKTQQLYANVATKAATVLEPVHTALLKAKAATMLVLSGRVSALTVLQHGLNAAVRAFPAALVVTGCLAILDVLKKLQDKANEMTDKGTKASRDELNRLNDRKALLEKTNTLVGQYNKSVAEYNRKKRDLKAAQNSSLANSSEGQASLQAMSTELKNLKYNLDQRLKVINDYKKKLSAMGKKKAAPTQPPSTDTGNGGSEGTPALAQGKETQGNTTSQDNTSAKRLQDIKQRYELELAYETDRYNQGLERQEEYLNNAKAIRERMYTEQLDALRKYGEQDSQEWQQIELQRQQNETDTATKLTELSLQDLERRHEREQALIKAQATEPDSPLYGDQEATNEALLQSDIAYLRAKQQHYKQSSDQWAELEAEINQRQDDARLEKQKTYCERLNQLRQEYAKKSAAETLAEELDALDQLKEAIPAKAEEIEKLKAEARKKYAGSSSGSSKGDNDMLSRAKQETQPQQSEESSGAGGWASAATGLAAVWQAVSQRQQVNDKLKQLYQEDLEACGDNEEAKAEVTAQYNAATEQNNSQTWQAITAAATVALQGISSMLSSASAYSKACSDLETAKIEANYDKQIEAAGKNSARKKKLEEKRDKELKAAKNKANQKAMKIEIAQAVASTALAAINSYASAAKVNWALGAVAAAMATAAGLVQIATIKKQHEAEAAGYYKGGFVSLPLHGRGPGRGFAAGGFTGGNSYRRAAGVVHEGEFVANHEAVNNPDILPALQLIDQAQRSNTVARLSRDQLIASLRGYAAGGFVAATPQSGGSGNPLTTGEGWGEASELRRTLEQTAQAVDTLQAALRSGITAKVQIDGTDGLDAQYRRYKRLKNT